MTIKPLYKYENADGSITITPIQRSGTDQPHSYRLIADEGMLLHKGEITTPCIDTNETEGWEEIPYTKTEPIPTEEADDGIY